MARGIGIDCVACGYSDAGTVGGGFENHLTYDPQLVHCPRCQEITTADTMKEPLACERCGSVEVTFCEETRGPAEPYAHVKRRGDYPRLEDGHLCPKCGKKSVRFSLYRMID